MTITRTTLFDQQKTMIKAPNLRASVLAAEGAIDGLAAPPPNKQVTMPMRNHIQALCQAVEQGISVQSRPYYHEIGNNTGWNLYYTAAGAARLLLLIGKPQMNQQGSAPNGKIDDYFDWVLDGEQESALNGNWEATEDDSVNMAYNGDLISDHNNKHFGGQPDAAQYTIGTVQRRKQIVAGMEAKAVEHGLNLEGEAFFRFNVVVGTDGVKPTQGQTTSIRVDTPGGPSQHSHPIPEDRAGTVSHDGKVKTAVRVFTTLRDANGLASVARYLTTIGAGRPAVTNLKADKHLYGHLRPPPSVFWTW